MEREEAVERICRKYGNEYMLRQLAEECAELAHALLKLIRAMRRETPDPYPVARANLLEELADVKVMWDAVANTLLSGEEQADMERIRDLKELRMIDRLL